MMHSSLGAIVAPVSDPTEQTLTIRCPDDWHLHVRDGAMLTAVIADTVRQFGRAIIMPNLLPPVTTTAQALEYRQRILKAAELAVGTREKHSVGSPDGFEPLMTLYLTDETRPEEITRAKESGCVHGVKLYPAGATTNSDAGVTDLLGRCSKVLERLESVGMPLLVHGEVTDPDIDLFDREAVFIDRVMLPLRARFPGLKIVFEHLTTQEGVDYVTEAQGPVAATITAHHLLYNRNALFQGGMRPHWYCLPVIKRERHRQALLAAATSGNKRFFLGTDSAPHTRGAKESACGCAGCYTARHAMALYATAFESVGRLDALEAFASLNGPLFYNLPPNAGTLTLRRQENLIPEQIPVHDGDTIVPLAAGETLRWQLDEV